MTVVTKHYVKTWIIREQVRLLTRGFTSIMESPGQSVLRPSLNRERIRTYHGTYIIHESSIVDLLTVLR